VSSVDWGTGEYEHTARRLEPAAEVVVARLGPRPGERVLDVGCGTGNAALAAARAGASVHGIDLAPRLVEVARARAADAGLDATFAVGDAEDLPVDDDAFDAAISVFGVIFAGAEAGARELLRVVRPGGRIVLTTWIEAGPTPKLMEAMRKALGAPKRPATWSDPDVLRSVFAPYAVELTEETIAFTAPSAEAYVDEHALHHPMWLTTAPALRAAGKEEQVLAEVRAVFADANEDPGAFRTTSRYHVATVIVDR